MAGTCGEPIADQSAFWALYDDALPKIYGFLVRRVGRDVAEDLTQEVFSTMARTATAQGIEAVSLPWLYTVAKSRMFDHLRRQRRAERNRVIAWVYRSEPTTSIDRTFHERNLTADTERALDALPTAQRAALVLHHLDDLSISEVADRLGRSVRATESLLARARHGFRSAFSEVSDV